MSTGSKFFIFFFFQFFFTIVASFLEIFDGGTDIKSVKIYGDSCNHCTDVAESKFRILYAGPLHFTVAINELLCMKNAGAQIAMDFS